MLNSITILAVVVNGCGCKSIGESDFVAADISTHSVWHEFCVIIQPVWDGFNVFFPNS